MRGSNQWIKPGYERPSRRGRGRRRGGRDENHFSHRDSQNSARHAPEEDGPIHTNRRLVDYNLEAEDANFQQHRSQHPQSVVRRSNANKPEPRQYNPPGVNLNSFNQNQKLSKAFEGRRDPDEENLKRLARQARFSRTKCPEYEKVGFK